MSSNQHTQITPFLPGFDAENDSEKWKPVFDWEGYDISNQGRIRGWMRPGPRGSRRSIPLILKPNISRGYFGFNLQGKGKISRRLIHELVLEAFVCPRPDGMICRHLDGCKTNNRVENLCWGTYIENAQDQFDHGTMIPRAPDPEPIMFFDSFIPIEAILPHEIWKPILDCRWAEVSSFGQIRSFCGHRPGVKPKRLSIPVIVNQRQRRTGHRDIRLITNDGQRPTFSVHRLVLEAFSSSSDTSFICRHVDGNASNNHISNLRWGTHKENQRDKVFHGRSNRGEKCPQSKLTSDQVLEIRRRLANGEIGNRLAKEYGVEQPTICNIRRRVTWKNI